MSVARYDLNACIGCRNCVNVCPMDVMKFDEEAHKSVIAYPENCQSCGQCYINCLGRSLAIIDNTLSYGINAYRAVATPNPDATMAATVATMYPAPAEEGAEGAASEGGWGGK